MSRRVRYGVVVVGAAVVAAVLAGLLRQPSESAQAASPEAAASRVAAGAGPRAVSALGRLEPEHGLIRLAAPTLPGVTGGVVMRSLLVEEGDDVAAGELLAITDLDDALAAAVAQAAAALELARRDADAARSAAESRCVLAEVQEHEAARRADWESSNIASREEAERARGAASSSRAACSAARTEAVARDAAIAVAEAALARARADHRQTRIHAPFAGRVLKVLSREGEAIGQRGAFEFGRVGRMVAVAEVYETDVRRVAVGQRATVTSAALAAPLAGRVLRIRPKVEKQDELGTDPAARKDARIVEIEVLLDEPEPAAALSNLQVTVVIDAG